VRRLAAEGVDTVLAKVAHTTPQSEMLRIAEHHPTATLLEVFELTRRENWHIEELTEAQKQSYGRMNALEALRAAQTMVETFASAFALDAPPRTQQWLATGEHLVIPSVLTDDVLRALGTACDEQLGTPGAPPVSVYDIELPVDTSFVESIARRALAALRDPLPPRARPSVIKKRTILRRTFAALPSGPIVRNANNQAWHQDSNLSYNDAPMLTLWMPLQSGAGTERPGLQLLDAPVSYFSSVHGDSSPGLLEAIADIFPAAETRAVRADRSEFVVFNGLTFHQTSTTETMTTHRDALLVRIIDRRFAHGFFVEAEDRELVDVG
jgi:hypothetical protein